MNRYLGDLSESSEITEGGGADTAVGREGGITISLDSMCS